MEPSNFFWLLLGALMLSLLLFMGIVFYRDLKENPELRPVFVVWSIMALIFLIIGLI